MAKTRRMTEGSIARHLLSYAIPLILGNFFQLTYNAVDSIIIGKFAGEGALAAVSAANPVMTIVILGVSGISIGASVLMSRFFGAGDMESLRREIGTTMLFGAGASFAVFAVGMAASGIILQILNVPREILPMATVYLRIIFVGFLFTFQYNILSASLRSERLACLEARRHLSWYLRGGPYAGPYKVRAVHVETLEDVRKVIRDIKRDLRDEVTL